MATLSITRSDLIALARKYRMLSELRREHERRWSTELRLAREFPGALGELERLPLAELDRRLEELELAARSGAVATWMLWVHAYHQSMRAALHVRRRAAGRGRLGATLAREIAREAEREAGIHCDAEFVLSVSRSREPLGNAVLALLGRELSAPTAVIRRELWF